MKNPLKRFFSKEKGNSEVGPHGDNEAVIEHDKSEQLELALKEKQPQKLKKKSLLFHNKKTKPGKDSDNRVVSKNPITDFSYKLLAKRIPEMLEYRQVYEQAGLPLVFEAYLSTGFFAGFLVIVPTFLMSFFLELHFFPHAAIGFPLLGSAVLGIVSFAITLLVWLSYPILRRRNFKSALENRLAYSFGILGVLAAAGMTLDRLFERIADSESNPVLADLAKRFLRNVRLFGMDSDSALKEVARHSPSQAFSGMLDSIAVAYKTTGSIHDLVMFESSRLLSEKSDNLRRVIASLAVMAELYITLVVVGPIIFIVMLSIFGLLPTGGLPDPILLINLIVFLGIPVLSIFFILLLDTVVGKT